MTDDDPFLDSNVAGAVAELEPLVQVSLATQEEILAFRERYDRLGRDAPLPPKSLRQIRDGRRRWLNLQERLAALARRYAPLAEQRVRSPLDPLLRFRGLSVSLLAALTLYDNYLSLCTIAKDDRLRRLLFDPDYGYGIGEGAFWKIVDGLNSTRAHLIVKALVDSWMEANDTLAPTDDVSTRLRQAIGSSVAYRYAREASLVERLPSEWSVRRAKFMDALDGLGESAVGALSKLFGNGIGLVETRQGKLWNDERVRQHLLGVMQPLDLLLEKTPFRLTDYFIPGHFGHVAIWMGTDPELEALDVWTRPEMQAESLRGCRAQVRAGQSVLEALRTGVELNTPERFLNVDDVAILRPVRLSGEQVVESLLRGFRQVGKEYDFNFDVETTESIVCSELPYHVYPGVDWQTGSTLGRFTINPDQVASLTLAERAAFRLIAFYHDGRLVEPGQDRALIETLMRDA